MLVFRLACFIICIVLHVYVVIITYICLIQSHTNNRYTYICTACMHVDFRKLGVYVCFCVHVHVHAYIHKSC